MRAHEFTLLIFLHSEVAWARPKQVPAVAIENRLGMQFVLVPAVEFMMGSDESPESLVQAYPHHEQSAQGKEKLLQGRSMPKNVFMHNRVRQRMQ